MSDVWASVKDALGFTHVNYDVTSYLRSSAHWGVKISHYFEVNEVFNTR